MVKMQEVSILRIICLLKNKKVLSFVFLLALVCITERKTRKGRKVWRFVDTNLTKSKWKRTRMAYRMQKYLIFGTKYIYERFLTEYLLVVFVLFWGAHAFG
jgi:hypothetical protein